MWSAERRRTRRRYWMKRAAQALAELNLMIMLLAVLSIWALWQAWGR